MYKMYIANPCYGLFYLYFPSKVGISNFLLILDFNNCTQLDILIYIAVIDSYCLYEIIKVLLRYAMYLFTQMASVPLGSDLVS